MNVENEFKIRNDRMMFSQYQLFLSILWMVVGVLQMVGALLTFFSADTLKNILKGTLGNGNIQITPTFLFILALTSIAPVVMAYLVIVIKNETVNRWLNFAMSIIIATMAWIDFFGELGYMFSFTVILGLIGIIIVIPANIFSTMIVWYSWKWPRPFRS